MKTISFTAISLVMGLTSLFVMLPNYSVQAATLYVGNTDCSDSGEGTEIEPFCSIQKGIDEASSGDTVQVAAGTYYENITMKNGIILEGTGAGDDPLIHSIIDGGSAGSVVTGASEAKLVNFTITHGSGPFGAGLNNAGGMDVNNCIFKDNHAAINGGGVNVSSGQSVFTDCIFLENSAGLGGGIYSNGGSQTLTNCSFIKNSTVSDGGGLYIYGASQTISDCSFVENSAASNGGGIYNSYSSPALNRCTFSVNSAVSESGGGIYNSHSSPAITNCSFLGNLAGVNGGGIYNIDNSSPTVSNSVFSVNSADQFGGGICNRNSSSPTVINSTFTGNRGALGGIDSYYSCNPIVVSCILRKNSGLTQVYYASGSTTTVTYSNVQGGFTGTGNIDEDPLFIREPGPGDDEEWGTGDDDFGDLHLSAGSPCIDRGDPSASGDTDMDGEPRIVDGDGDETAVIDMGADEFLDADEDGTPDRSDLCPADPDKAEPGVCGCGIIDTDTDEDGIPDCNDTDDDDDGMPDDWETEYSLDPLVNDANEDPDHDGYTNIQEYREGGDPHNPGVPFPWELFYPAFMKNNSGEVNP